VHPFLKHKKYNMAFGRLLPAFAGIAYAALAAVSCSSAGADTATISGKIEGHHSSYIVFRSSSAADSVLTDASGKFTFSINSASPKFVRISPQSGLTGIVALVAPGEKAKLLVRNPRNWAENYEITGSEGSAKIKKVHTVHQHSLEALEQLSSSYTAQVQAAASEAEKAELTERAIWMQDSIFEAEKSYLKTFIESNLQSAAIIPALYQSFDTRTGKPMLLDDTDGFRYFKMADSALSLLYPDSEDISNFKQSVAQMQMDILRQQEAEASLAQRRLAVGDIAHPISLPDTSGRLVSLEALRGKVVLLDFWASWCPPCRAENPHLVQAHKRYAAKGFEIFQVSLDRDRAAWVNAIKADGLYWKNHASDLQFWNSPIAHQYGLQSIPASYLLDKDGRVIAKDLRGAQLDKKLAEILD
jgi:thiol-disulfide isomerase/thioredoxin